ncbi:hypothetical protein [Streptomyces pristinaespiralis]|uniref:hypothetical protein n=1 Tax=Streptomyces pristinaespiralis TaxID=38300 RepID=UPI003836BCF5
MPHYRTVHRRLDALKLPAKYHPCAWCGLTASDWAFQWDDADALDSEHGPYSENSTSYRAMCRSCHKAFDRAHRDYGAERFRYEAARLAEAAYDAVSDERRTSEARAREVSRTAALSYAEAREARMSRRSKPESAAEKAANARMTRGYRHNALTAEVHSA